MNADISLAAFDALGARLTAKAKAIATAAAQSRSLALRTDPRRWRSAALLWPLFTKA
jgi:hypothetical protein